MRGVTTKLTDPTRAAALERPIAEVLAWSDAETKEARAHTVALGADHFGVEVAQLAGEYLSSSGVAVLDYATAVHRAAEGNKYNYSAGALPALLALSQGLCDRVLLVCGNGIGMRNMARVWPATRVCYGDIFNEVRSARRAEDANVLALGARLFGELRDPANADLVRLFVKTFVATPFEGMPKRYGNQDEEMRGWAERAIARGPGVSINDFADAVEKYPMLYGVVDLEAVIRARAETGGKAGMVGRMGSLADAMIESKRKR